MNSDDARCRLIEEGVYRVEYPVGEPHDREDEWLSLALAPGDRSPLAPLCRLPKPVFRSDPGGGIYYAGDERDRDGSAYYAGGEGDREAGVPPTWEEAVQRATEQVKAEAGVGLAGVLSYRGLIEDEIRRRARALENAVSAAGGALAVVVAEALRLSSWDADEVAVGRGLGGFVGPGSVIDWDAVPDRGGRDATGLPLPRPIALSSDAGPPSAERLCIDAGRVARAVGSGEVDFETASAAVERLGALYGLQNGEATTLRMVTRWVEEEVDGEKRTREAFCGWDESEGRYMTFLERQAWAVGRGARAAQEARSELGRLETLRRAAQRLAHAEECPLGERPNGSSKGAGTGIPNDMDHTDARERGYAAGNHDAFAEHAVTRYYGGLTWREAYEAVEEWAGGSPFTAGFSSFDRSTAKKKAVREWRADDAEEC